MLSREAGSGGNPVSATLTSAVGGTAGLRISPLSEHCLELAVPGGPIGLGGTRVEPRDQRCEKRRGISIYWLELSSSQPGASPIPIIARPSRAAHPSRRRREKRRPPCRTW